jgi:hypothetical protein
VLVNKRKDYTMYMAENWVCCAYVEIVAVSKIYEVAVSVYFTYESKTAQPHTTIVGQVVTEWSSD